jgi:uncharacterized protein YecE (DUF72 family)
MAEKDTPQEIHQIVEEKRIYHPVSVADAENKIRNRENLENIDPYDNFMDWLFVKDMIFTVWDFERVNHLIEQYNKLIEDGVLSTPEVDFIKYLDDIYDLAAEYAKRLVYNNRDIHPGILEKIMTDPWRCYDLARFHLEAGKEPPGQLVHSITPSSYHSFKYAEELVAKRTKIPDGILHSISRDVDLAVKLAERIILEKMPINKELVSAISNEMDAAFRLAEFLKEHGLPIPEAISNEVKKSPELSAEFTGAGGDGQEGVPAELLKPGEGFSKAVLFAKNLSDDGKKIPASLIKKISADIDSSYELAAYIANARKDVPYELSDTIATNLEMAFRLATELVESTKRIPIQILRALADNREYGPKLAVAVYSRYNRVPEELKRYIGEGASEPVEQKGPLGPVSGLHWFKKADKEKIYQDNLFGGKPEDVTPKEAVVVPEKNPVAYFSEGNLSWDSTEGRNFLVKVYLNYPDARTFVGVNFAKATGWLLVGGNNMLLTYEVTSGSPAEAKDKIEKVHQAMDIMKGVKHVYLSSYHSNKNAGRRAPLTVEAKMKPAVSPEALAKKWKVSIDVINKKLDKGQKVEREHTNSDKEARHIASHHIEEFLNYYEELGKMEEKMKKRADLDKAIHASTDKKWSPAQAGPVKFMVAPDGDAWELPRGVQHAAWCEDNIPGANAPGVDSIEFAIDAGWVRGGRDGDITFFHGMDVHTLDKSIIDETAKAWDPDGSIEVETVDKYYETFKVSDLLDSGLTLSQYLSKLRPNPFAASSKGMLVLGSSGFNHKSWGTSFYPKATKEYSKLEYYSTHFPAVEIACTEHFTPRRDVFEKWASQVPYDFEFSFVLRHKATPNYVLTHGTDDIQLFFNRAATLGKKFGPVVIIIPEGEKYFPGAAKQYFDMMPRHKYALDIRSKSWYNKEVFEVMSRINATFVRDRLDLSNGIGDWNYFRLPINSSLKQAKMCDHGSCLASLLRKAGKKTYVFSSRDWDEITPAMLLKMIGDFVEKRSVIFKKPVPLKDNGALPPSEKIRGITDGKIGPTTLAIQDKSEPSSAVKKELNPMPASNLEHMSIEKQHTYDGLAAPGSRVDGDTSQIG